LEKEEEDYLRVKTRVLIVVRLFPWVTTLFVTCTDTNLISSPEIGTHEVMEERREMDGTKRRMEKIR
jgi:hypothetical protein